MPIPEADPIVVAPTPTPFRADDRVDFEALEHNFRRWLETPLSGFVLTTANGEELALSEGERVEIVRVAAAAHEGQRFTIAGVDNPSTLETLRLAERYAVAGADLVRVRVPRGLSGGAVEDYFESIARGSLLPVVVIHQTFSGAPAASPEILGAVCAMDNVFGYITDHDIRFEAYVRSEVPDDRRFWICNGGLLAYGALMGANGALHVAWQCRAEAVHGHHDARAEGGIRGGTASSGVRYKPRPDHHQAWHSGREGGSTPSGL